MKQISFGKDKSAYIPDSHMDVSIEYTYGFYGIERVCLSFNEMDQLCEWWKNNKPNKSPSLEQIRREIVEAVVDGCLEYGYDVYVKLDSEPFDPLALSSDCRWLSDKQHILNAINSCRELYMQENVTLYLKPCNSNCTKIQFIRINLDGHPLDSLPWWGIEDDDRALLKKALELIDKYEGEI